MSVTKKSSKSNFSQKIENVLNFKLPPYRPKTCWVILVWPVVHFVLLILIIPGCNICFAEMHAQHFQFHNLPAKRQKQALCFYLVLPHPSQARGCFSVSLSGHLLFATLFDHWYKPAMGSNCV